MRQSSVDICGSLCVFFFRSQGRIVRSRILTRFTYSSKIWYLVCLFFYTLFYGNTVMCHFLINFHYDNDILPAKSSGYQQRVIIRWWGLFTDKIVFIGENGTNSKGSYVRLNEQSVTNYNDYDNDAFIDDSKKKSVCKFYDYYFNQ